MLRIFTVAWIVFSDWFTCNIKFYYFSRNEQYIGNTYLSSVTIGHSIHEVTKIKVAIEISLLNISSSQLMERFGWVTGWEVELP